jgi:type I restriction enzyme, S subunit
MSKDWKYGKLEDAVDKGSSNISLRKIKDDTGDYPVFKAKGFAQNVSFFHQNKEYLAIIKDGAGIGRVSKHPAKSSVVATMQYLIPKEGFDISFVQYFLLCIDFKKYSQGSTIPHIYFKDYKSEPFPLLPLPEQKRIVTILDQAFEAIDKAKANTEQNLQSAKDLFESYLEGVFEDSDESWMLTTFEDVCEITSKLIDPKKEEFQDMVHVGAGNIKSRSGKLVALQTARQEKLISGKFVFDETMVLYSKIRPKLMKVVSPSFKGLCSADIYPLAPTPNMINKGFLYFLLLTKSFTDYAIGGSQRAGMPKVNRKHLFAYSFKIPPLETQREITHSLKALSSKINDAERNYKMKLKSLTELKHAILQKAFSGELTSNN